jgi:hypothetical protein
MLYKSDKTFPIDDTPIGMYRNGNAFHVGATITSPIYIMGGTSGSADNTRFTLFYVPTSGEYSVEYQLTSYTDGTIQEAVFKYDPFMQLGDTIINQNWASPALGIRKITGCNMSAGFYWLCLRNSSSANTMFVYGSSSIANSSQCIDFGYYINNYPLNGLSGPPSTGLYAYSFWDNSTNPATRINYNGTLSDFSPYKNQSNKYLFPDASTPTSPWKIRILRTA